MFKYITKKIILSFSMWIIVWLWILVTYAANITSISWTYNSWDTLGVEWFNDLKARLSNIYGSWANVGIGTATPTTKLDVNWIVKATSFQWDWSALAWVGSTPTWAIMAFYLANCPSWWILANWANSTPDLRWAFIRWMWWDVNGRDVARTLWDYQTDDFKSHLHIYYRSAWDGGPEWMPPPSGFWASLTNTTSAWWTETRPKNIALIYCMKQ